MRYAGRFVVDTHTHVQRASVGLAKRGIKRQASADLYREVAAVTWYDNSARCLYDMERYGIDVAIIQCGGLARGMDNDLDVEIAERYPGKFAVLAFPTTMLNKALRGEAKWTLEEAVEETEERLRTGKYKGIGQGLPIAESESYLRIHASAEERAQAEPLTERKILERSRLFFDLARKYKVVPTVSPAQDEVLGQLLDEYPDVPTVRQLTRLTEELCFLALGHKNLYLEVGGAAELYENALFNLGVSLTQIIFGTDWGAAHYVYRHPPRGNPGYQYTSSIGQPFGPARYQSDYWGWALYQIDKLRDKLTQDELNLILGGNAARIFKLEVPYTRMFPEGRPDIFGSDWEKFTPYVSREQVRQKYEG